MVAGRLDGDLSGRLSGRLTGDSAGLSGDPSTLIAVGDRRAWFRADQGITEVALRISAWADIWGNATLVQAVGASQPLLGSFNGQASVDNDDGARYLGAAAMTTTIDTGDRVYLWLYCKKGAANASKTWCIAGAGAVGNPRISIGTDVAGTASAQLRSGAISRNVTMSAIAGTGARLLEAGFTEGGADSGVMSGAGFTAGTIGAITAGSMVALGVYTFAGIASGAQGPVGQVAEVVLMRGVPTGEVKAAMRNYFQARYGNI